MGAIVFSSSFVHSLLLWGPQGGAGGDLCMHTMGQGASKELAASCSLEAIGGAHGADQRAPGQCWNRGGEGTLGPGGREALSLRALLGQLLLWASSALFGGRPREVCKGPWLLKDDQGYDSWEVAEIIFSSEGEDGSAWDVGPG